MGAHLRCPPLRIFPDMAPIKAHSALILDTAEASASGGRESEAELRKDREFEEGAPAPTRNDHVRRVRENR